MSDVNCNEETDLFTHLITKIVSPTVCYSDNLKRQTIVTQNNSARAFLESIKYADKTQIRANP